MSEFFATASFCDDIRTEATGKRVIVGEYAANVFVRKIPHSIPKLFVTVRLGHPDNFKLPGMTVRLHLPGGSILERGLPPPPDALSFGSDGSSISPRRFIAAAIRFDDIEITEPGEILATVSVPGLEEELVAGSLYIAAPDKADRTSPGEVVVDDQQVTAAMLSITHYIGRSRNFDRRDRAKLAQEILDSLSEAYKDFVGVLPERAPTSVWTNHNTCNVWYPNPRENVQNIRLHVQGARTYEIKNNTKFGFTVCFDTKEEDEVEFTILDDLHDDTGETEEK